MINRLFRTFLSLAILTGLCAQEARSEAENHSNFTYPLFDGTSLDGWNIENDCQVEVQDGNLLLKAGDGWLRSDHTYQDFSLHIEWKALQKKNYDAGIYFRSGTAGKPFPKPAYQINLLEGKEGNIGNLPGAVSSGLIRPGEWNTFDIHVRGDSVSTIINEKPAYEVSGIDVRNGYIGIQVEVPKGGQFLMRNIRITEIGYQSLFNGKNHSQWVGADKPAEVCWKVADGSIQCTGEKGPWLRSENEYADFNFRFDYQVAPGGNSGIYVRVPADGNHHRNNLKEPPAGFEVQVLDDNARKYATLKPYQYCGSVYDIAGAGSRVSKPAGQWNTLEINCLGQTITTSHNGVVIVNVNPEQHPLIMLRKVKGYLGLQNHSSVVKFRKLRIGPAVKSYPTPVSQP